MSFNPVPKPPPREKKAPKPIRSKNVARSADAFARAYHSEERVEWVKGLPCIVGDCRNTSIDNAHIEIDGAGRKAGYDKIVPLCRTHHRKLDTHPEGHEGFEGEFYVDLNAMALDCERAWRRYAGHAHPNAFVATPSTGEQP